MTQSTHLASPDPLPETITVREATGLLRCTERFIYGAIADGSLPAFKLAGRKAIRLRRADVEALLQPVSAA